MNPAAFEHRESRALPLVETDEMCPSSATSINPSKMDAASPSAASPPGKLCGSDCSGSTGTACTPGGDSGLHDLYFPSQYTQERYSAQAPRTEEDLRGRQRSRLLETTSTLGEVLGDGRYSNKCAWKGTRLQYFDIGMAAAGPSREEAVARRACLRGTKIFLEHFFSLLGFQGSRGSRRIKK